MAAETRILPRLTASATNHTAGIYADMTVDGPEIGTLVVVVDRAKNLPNLRTMGKQDPYCAARLGKEAKKTDTDLRGGQTPRWDQELRFTVHESPDYHKIKVSVFSDDKKKTDLIGETWVSLEELLRPGGGQSDSWHPLNVKGRYAGEIRIELTFYDSRPKVEKSRNRKQSNASSSQHDQSTAMLGPRQLAPRRPLPTDHAAEAPPSPASSDPSVIIPQPQSGLRRYHTPPRQPQDQYPMPLGGQYMEQNHIDQNNSSELGGSSRPLPIPGLFQSQTTNFEAPPQNSESFKELPRVELYDRDFEDEPNDCMPYTDDPNALQAVEAQQSVHQDMQYHPQPTPPRHDRVQALSGSSNPRPSLPTELSHAHSAPQLGPHERYPYSNEQHHRFTRDYNETQSNGSSPANNGGHDSYKTTSWDPISQNSQENRQTGFNERYEASPPPPPPHRNSAPSVPQAMPRAPNVQQANIPPLRSLHVSTNRSDMHNGFERSASEPPHVQPHNQSPNSPMNMSSSSYSPGSSPWRQSYPEADYSARYDVYPSPFQQHLSRWADPNTRPRDEMAHDPRGQKNNRHYGPSSNQDQGRPSSYQHLPPYGDQRPTRPLSYHDDPRQTYLEAPPPDRSGPPEPHVPQHYQTPRKSISPRPSPSQSQSSTPYSPDSFNSLNPAHSRLSTPDDGNKFEPTPMYSSRSSSPTKSSPPEAPLSNSLNQPQISANSPSARERPIMGSDGRIKDPTDHLPPSSYAPEPERRGNRPSTFINIKSRFGPREERGNAANTPSSPISPISTTNSPTDRLTKQSPPSGTASSPLAPMHSSILNTHMNMNRGYNLSSPYPPPVPGKIPLGGYQAQIDEPDHFEMARLSLEDDDGNDQLDPEAPKISAAGRALLQQGKVKKSRWGL